MNPVKEMALTRHILEAAASHPDRIAFCVGEERLSYRELVKAARRQVEALSAWRRYHPPIIPGDQGLRLPVLLLGCLLSRRPYVVLDPTAPVLRQHQLIQDVEEAGPDLPGLAYLMYTSGSTGRPKGVQISRDNLDFFLSATRTLPLEPPGEAVWLTHAPWSFDLSVLPLWQGLSRGDRVVWLDTTRGVDFPRLAAEMAQSGATCWVSTPSFARLWLRDPTFREALLPRLSLFFFCGEVLEPALVLALAQRFPRARVVNAYGPTEATVAATLTEIPRELAEAGGPLPVGRPLPGISLAVLGENGEPLSPGREGEIAIGGPGVGLGYRGRLEEGQLWFHGRRDLQVKHRGCRIELADIEQNLLALPQVAEAVAVLLEDRLLALVVPASGAAPTPPELMQGLRRRLPHYLLPERILPVTALPLTSQGKLDRREASRMAAERMKGGRCDG